MAANEACTYKFRGDWQFYEEWRGRLAAVTVSRRKNVLEVKKESLGNLNLFQAFAVLSAVLHVFSAIYAKDVYI